MLLDFTYQLLLCIMFIQDYRYLERGSTDGVFGGYRYFQCDENCGLFVSLEKLAPEPPPSPGADYSVAKKPKNPPVDSSANTGKVSSHSFDPPVDQPHQHFKVNDRVVVYNKKNIAVHGTVRWTGRRVQTRTLESNHIGIETVSSSYCIHRLMLLTFPIAGYSGCYP